MRIGIYGGTFSPVHSGHLLAAREFVRGMELDKLLVIPAAQPPHKEMQMPVSANDRLEMCRLAFGEMENVEISDVEISRGGKSYTVDTVTALREKYPRDELFLLVGTDMILTFDLWYRYEDILSLCDLVYVRRETDSDLNAKISEKISFLEKQTGKKIRHIKIDPVEISSSELRQMLLEGEDTEDLIPEKVMDFILKKGIYTKTSGENDV